MQHFGTEMYIVLFQSGILWDMGQMHYGICGEYCGEEWRLYNRTALNPGHWINTIETCTNMVGHGRRHIWIHIQTFSIEKSFESFAKSEWFCSGPILKPISPKYIYASVIRVSNTSDSVLVKIMACGLFGAKPLSKPMLAYCQLDH